MAKSRQTANILRYVARGVLLLVAIFWFIFALLSGAEGYGGGLWGVLRNSINALPWLLLFVFVYVAWKQEMVGGILIIGMGIFTIFFFQSYRYLVVFFGVSVALITLGLMFVGSWYLRQKR
ncbi:MAG: hypothetical protein AAFN11_16495 [Chloroflexota bacterium]